MNNADLIVATVKKAGINYGFGIPSGNVLPLIEAMRLGGVEFILTAHEGSAGFAADVMGRLTGRPGLCISTLGPGATNLATGIGNAWLDRSPMLAITCNLNTSQLGRRIQMYIDHHSLFKPITKASLPLRSGCIGKTISQAIKLALSEPLGPVHLDLPEDVAIAETEEDIPEIFEGDLLPIASEQSLQKAIKIIRNAKRPVAVLGSSAMRLKNFSLLKKFVEQYNLPFATTTMAKGLIDESHPFAVGCIERACRQHQRLFLDSADLIIGIGYDTIEVEFEAWIGTTPLLQVDIEPVDIEPSVRLIHQVTGDLSKSLKYFLSKRSTKNSWALNELAKHKEVFNKKLRPKADLFTAYEAIDAVRAALPKNGILSFDVGAHTHQIASQWNVPAHHSFLITNGWSSMGFGLPAAIAAKIACPQRDVVCLIGDGCFQMTCGELATAKRLGLNLPVIVLDDRWLALIRIKQVRRQFGVYGTELQTEEYRSPPEHYFGVPALGVSDAQNLEKAVKEALKAKHPTVIEALVNSDHYLETVFD